MDVQAPASSALPQIRSAQHEAAAASSFTPVAQDTHLFDIAHPETYIDDQTYTAGPRTGSQSGYAALDDAIAAARQLVAPDTASIAVLESGARFGLSYLSQAEMNASAHYDYVPASMPVLGAPHSIVTNLNDALAAVVTTHGTITAAELQATGRP